MQHFCSHISNCSQISKILLKHCGYALLSFARLCFSVQLPSITNALLVLICYCKSPHHVTSCKCGSLLIWKYSKLNSQDHPGVTFWSVNFAGTNHWNVYLMIFCIYLLRTSYVLSICAQLFNDSNLLFVLSPASLSLLLGRGQCVQHPLRSTLKQSLNYMYLCRCGWQGVYLRHTSIGWKSEYNLDRLPALYTAHTKRTRSSNHVFYFFNRVND